MSHVDNGGIALLFPLPFSPLTERMGCCTASCAGQLSRDAGTEHCSWLLTRNGEVSDNGVQNKTCVLCFLKHSISCVFKESSMREFQADGRTISMLFIATFTKYVHLN